MPGDYPRGPWEQVAIFAVGWLLTALAVLLGFIAMIPMIGDPVEGKPSPFADPNVRVFFGCVWIFGSLAGSVGYRLRHDDDPDLRSLSAVSRRQGGFAFLGSMGLLWLAGRTWTLSDWALPPAIGAGILGGLYWAGIFNSLRR